MIRNLINRLLLILIMAFAGGAFAQSFVVQPGLNAIMLADGNLFKGTSSGIPEGPQSGTLEATLQHNGRVIVRQSGTIDPISGQVVPSVSGLSEPYQTLAQIGALPVGTYQLCIKSPGGQPNCQTFQISRQQNAAHLQLIYPVNATLIDAPFPMLTWMSGFNALFNDVTYRLVVNQKLDANRGNFFAHRSMAAQVDISGLRETSLVYPVESPALSPGESYLWGVEVYVAGLLVAQSQVWSFRLKEDAALNELPIAHGYMDISRMTDHTQVHILGTLKLRYTPFSSAEKATISIIDAKGKQVDLKSNALLFKSSDPYEAVNFERQASLKHLKAYTVELKFSSGMTKRFEMTYVNPAFYTP